jgi:hypothetical protein
MKLVAAWGFALVAACFIAFGAANAAGEATGLAAQLRYIGRDEATGMPRSVDDSYIATVERGVERYGKDERPAIPPPPVTGLDVRAIAIPKLGVAAPVGRYGVDTFGRIDVPQDARTVGWNPGYAALPGTGGATFFAAHFEFAGAPGVFFRLSTLAAGDRITVTLSDGTLVAYAVRSTVDYALGVIDMGALLKGREGLESITLMTCSGPPNEGEYAFRTVVLAERVDS